MDGGGKMRKVINVLGWVSVLLSILAIIFTWLTTYQFTYRLQSHFINLTVVQWCMVFTMVFLGLNFIDFKKNTRNIMYAFLCILFALGNMFFMYMKVF